MMVLLCVFSTCFAAGCIELKNLLKTQLFGALQLVEQFVQI